MNHTSHQHSGADHTLSVADLHVHYGSVCALERIGFEVQCGECVAVLGRNGTGKSTLLKAIAGLVPTASGSVTWCGGPLAKVRHEVGYLPQREDVDWQFPVTLRGLVEMGRFPQTGWFRKFSDADHASVDGAIAAMDLGDLQHRQIAELSGGQQQRAFIARALAQEAHIFLLDEPFAGLDLPSQQTLAEHLRRLAATGHLVLASHHDLAGAPEIFSRAILLDRILVAEGDVREVIARLTDNKEFSHVL